METFFESGIGLAVLSGIAMVGLLIKLFSDIRINKLMKQTRAMGETKDKQLKLWKFKFENTYKMNRGMNNVPAYIKKNFSQYRVCGITLERFDRINVTLAGLVILLTLAAVGFTVVRNMQTDITTMYLFYGALLAGVMLMWERICYTSVKKKFIINNIIDFYENTLTRKLELGNEIRSLEKNNKPVETLPSESKKNKRYTPIEEKIFDREEKSGYSDFRRNRFMESSREKGVSKTAEEVRDSLTEDFTKNDIHGSGSIEEAIERRDSEKIRRDVEYLKQSLDRIAAGRETEYVRPTRKLTESEEKLIEEFIKEYL